MKVSRIGDGCTQSWQRGTQVTNLRYRNEARYALFWVIANGCNRVARGLVPGLLGKEKATGGAKQTTVFDNEKARLAARNAGYEPALPERKHATLCF